jgi:hypothetical protein
MLSFSAELKDKLREASRIFKLLQTRISATLPMEQHNNSTGSSQSDGIRLIAFSTTVN